MKGAIDKSCSSAKVAQAGFGAAETGVALRRGLVVKRPITPPCHGGDRRFESGRARHEKGSPLWWAFFVARACQARDYVVFKLTDWLIFYNLNAKENEIDLINHPYI